MSFKLKRKEDIKQVSVKWQLMLLLILLPIPLCILFLREINLSRNKLNEQIALSQHDALSGVVTIYQKEMEASNSFVFRDCWSVIENSENDEETLAKLVSLANDFLADQTDITAIYFRNENNAQLAVRGSALKDEKEQLMSVGDTVCNTSSETNTGWEIYKDDASAYYLRHLEKDGVEIVLITDLNEMVTQARVSHGLDQSIVFLDGDQPLTRNIWREGGSSTNTPTNSDDYFFWKNGKTSYLVVQDSIALLKVQGATQYTDNMEMIYGSAIGIMTIFVISVLLAMLYLQVTFFKPLNSMVITMQQIVDGNMDVKVPQSHSREFNRITDLFNKMLDQLKNQKILTYEKEISANRAQMDALRLQIRRHFFLNCLKNIYAMASNGDIEEVKEMTLLMGTNLRYTLNFYTNTVKLETEIKQCRDYITLQGIGQEYKPELVVHVSDELLNFEVPPVSLLTIVENCCKYGMQMDRVLVVTITAERRTMDDQDYIILSVMDNGMGFSDEDIRVLNNDLERMQNSGHVGIVNTITRFKMIYGNDSAALFMNHNGAEVELMIPMRKGKDEITNS